MLTEANLINYQQLMEVLHTWVSVAWYSRQIFLVWGTGTPELMASPGEKDKENEKQRRTERLSASLPWLHRICLFLEGPLSGC